MAPDRAPRDDADAALTALRTEIDGCMAQLHHARDRIDRLLETRQTGRAWLDVITDEARPLVVESISTVLSRLARAGHVWRREQALALRAEDVSINRIAALFGVTRQRISTLLRESGTSGGPAQADSASIAL